MILHRFESLPLLALIVVISAQVTAHEDQEGRVRSHAIEWQGAEHVTRIAAMDYDFHGGGFFMAYQPPGGVKNIEGRQCLVGPYFFFDVDDEFAFDVDETITLELLDGPFDYFQGCWVFKALSDAACKVSLDLEFKVNNSVLGVAAGRLFDRVSNNLVDALGRRANQLYG